MLWVWATILTAIAGASAAAAVVVVRSARRRGVGRWVGPCLVRSVSRGGQKAGQPIHLLLCIADHYEPQVGRPPPERAAERVKQWTERYPRLLDRFRDVDGH